MSPGLDQDTRGSEGLAQEHTAGGYRVVWDLKLDGPA